MNYPAKITKMSFFGNLAELDFMQWERCSRSLMKEMIKKDVSALRAVDCRKLSPKQTFPESSKPYAKLTEESTGKGRIRKKKVIKGPKKYHSDKKRAVRDKIWNIAM
jgi:hypothetical protein